MISLDSKIALLQREIDIELMNRLELIQHKKENIYELTKNCEKQETLLEKLYPNRKIFSTEDLQKNFYSKNSADLIFSNFVFINYPVEKFFEKSIQVLNNDGLLLFAALGKDSFYELENKTFENKWTIQAIGESLIQSGFYQPVLDVENITLCYKNDAELIWDLERHTLIQHFLNTTHSTRLTLQVIYGHAWGKEKKETQEVKIPLSDFIKGLTIKTENI